MTETRYFLPAILNRDDGQPRRVGVEIEMSGIDLAGIACQLNIAYGGRIGEVSPYDYTVSGTSLGDFRVYLDNEYLQKFGRDRLAEHRHDVGEIEQFAADALQALMRNMIPCELASGPIDCARIHELDVIIRRLRDHGAKGTRSALVSAFGVHLNPELPNLEPATVLAYLRAFLCLQSWLEGEEGIVFMRKLSPFIRNFPSEYIDRVLRADYSTPTVAMLIDDYLRHNPTRNRILDLLPLLAWIDEKRVRSVVPDEKLRRRPTLHYRLPNSDIDQPDWSLAPMWNRWLQVEALANDATRLEAVCQAFREMRRSDFFSLGGHDWREEIRGWIVDLSSA